MPVSQRRPGLLRRLWRPDWPDVNQMVNGPEVAGLSHARAETWALVLSARGVPHRVSRTSAGFELRVPEWHAERAEREIRLFLAENRPDPEAPPPRPVHGGMAPTLWFMALLIAFFVGSKTVWTGVAYPEFWLEAGSANAARILAGQWWRLITALTLHADAAHVLGNAAIGGAFIVLLCQRLGNGLGWLLVMLCGVLGNLVNTLVLGPPHDSIGFSTAVFAAAGLLAGVRFPEGGMRGLLVPLAAGLGLLAMLGSGGENTDLGAHLFGFGCGVGAGALAGAWTRKRGLPGGRIDLVLLSVAWVLPVAAWVAAFGVWPAH